MLQTPALARERAGARALFKALLLTRTLRVMGVVVEIGFNQDTFLNKN
jgi:hypothetical protein